MPRSGADVLNGQCKDQRSKINNQRSSLPFLSWSAGAHRQVLPSAWLKYYLFVRAQLTKRSIERIVWTFELIVKRILKRTVILNFYHPRQRSDWRKKKRVPLGKNFRRHWNSNRRTKGLEFSLVWRMWDNGSTFQPWWEHEKLFRASVRSTKRQNKCHCFFMLFFQWMNWDSAIEEVIRLFEVSSKHIQKHIHFFT